MSRTYALYSIANLADILLTYVGLPRQVCVEMNPAVAWAMAQWGVAGGLVVAGLTAQALVYALHNRFPKLPAVIALLHTVAAAGWIIRC